VLSRRTDGIGDYALVGDGRAAALVSTSGSVDWLAWPRFDSAAVLSRILDADVGGYFRFAPREPLRVERAYVGDSAVLATRFETHGGVVTIFDALPVAVGTKGLRPDHELLRIARCEAGDVDLELELALRPDYGTSAPPTPTASPLGVRVEANRALYTLRADVPLEVVDARVIGRAHLRAGESAAVSLAYAHDSPAILAPLGPFAQQRLDETVRVWTAWASKTRYEGPHRDAVLRSALTLKLLAFAPSGAIVAAPTTSLPEQVGGPLNWDYRFCWPRDASMTARALLRLGHIDEARAFVAWLLHATRLDYPDLRVLYDVYGRAPPRERELPMRGFADSRPVRVGNAADRQLQLDVFGEVIDAAFQLLKYVGDHEQDTTELLEGLAHRVVERWHEPDHGIWEPRERPRGHTHSRLLSWVALDRVLALDEAGVMRLWHKDAIRDAHGAIRADLEAHGWSARRGAYVGALDGCDLDASVLLMSYFGFEDPSSARMHATYAAIREELGRGTPLLWRYLRSQGDEEGAFGICSFWGVDHLARGGGPLSLAEHDFAALLDCGNDLGLFAEEIGLADRAPLGNFPQAFTHVGLVNAALTLEDRRQNEAFCALRREAP
jgi:GH15 family glucan-1,4-alpha-glucosidase